MPGEDTLLLLDSLKDIKADTRLAISEVKDSVTALHTSVHDHRNETTIGFGRVKTDGARQEERLQAHVDQDDANFKRIGKTMQTIADQTAAFGEHLAVEQAAGEAAGEAARSEEDQSMSHAKLWTLAGAGTTGVAGMLVAIAKAFGWID